MLEPTPVGEAIRIKLKYASGRRTVISGLTRVSRPGRRRYVITRRYRASGWDGDARSSTSVGVMTGLRRVTAALAAHGVASRVVIR